MTYHDKAPRAPRPAAVVLATALAVGIGFTGCSHPETNGAECTGLQFASPKGGPGAIQMRVFPAIDGKIGKAEATGEVIEGNDKGTPIAPPADTPEDIPTPYGQFTFTWDTAEKSPQTSKVTAVAHFAGKQLTCPTTTLTFNPQTFDIAPHAAHAPY